MPQEMHKYEFPDEIEIEPSNAFKVGESKVEIEVENDTPPLDRNRKPVEKEIVDAIEEENLEKFNNDHKKALKEAKKLWHQERRDKEAAQREQNEAINVARRAIEENKKLKERLNSGELAHVDTIKESANQELEAAKVAFKAAYESGDADKLLEAQERMTNAKLRADRAESFKPTVENTLQAPEADVQIQQPQVNAPDKKALKWQKKNKWFGRDEEMTSLALGLHEKLVRKGVPAGSSEYYDRIDETMRKRFPENFKKETQEVQVEEPEQVTKPKASTVVAPANRSTSPKKIRMSKTQVLLAKKLGLTPEQYARELTKLEQ
jgi:hypothetical protein